MKNLEKRINSLKERQLQTIFELSFIRVLSPDTQHRLRLLEKELLTNENINPDRMARKRRHSPEGLQ